MNGLIPWSVMLALVLTGPGAAAEPAPARQKDLAPQEIRAAVTRALPLIEKGAVGHVEQRSCFSCHHQALPMFAMRVARERGFTVDQASFDSQLTRTQEVLARWEKQNPSRKTFVGGAADTATYALLALDLGEWKPDAMTAAVVDYLLWRDQERGYWRATHADRPPSEASSFTTTALAVRGLKRYGDSQKQEQVASRIAAARSWLLKTRPRDTEDRVFRLWGLHHAQAEGKDIAAAVQELLKTQREDGGFGQLADMDSDAYATGSALVALHLAGELAVSDPAYQRGLRFLLACQQKDGSWLVKTRSRNRFQKYFESGFPHGEDQWISLAASSWAATALALACTP